MPSLTFVLAIPSLIGLHPIPLPYAPLCSARHYLFRDDYLLLSNLVGFFLSDILPLQNTPLWNGPGFLITILIHMGPAEYLYYWLHRALHHHYLYSRYHSHHHSSFVTEAVSGEGCASSS